MSASAIGSCRWSSDGIEEARRALGIAEPALAQQTRDDRRNAERRGQPRRRAARRSACDSQRGGTIAHVIGYSVHEVDPEPAHVPELLVAPVQPRVAESSALGRSREHSAHSTSSTSVAAAAGSVCAPPIGSGMISSMIPALSRSGAVSFSASAASTFLAGVAPENRRAALGRNHAVDRELLHQHAVADRDAERAAAAALAADDDDDRRVEQHHVAQVDGDRLGDAALLGLDARIRRRRVDEDDDRPAELLGQPHRAQRLAVALGPRVAEVAVDLLLGVAALDVADEQHRLALVVGEAGHDRVVVGKAAVAVDLDEVREQPLDEVLEARAGSGWRATSTRCHGVSDA